MANPTLNWRFVGTQTFTAGSLAGALDALYTLGTKATFNDGTTRTPGTGSAWTWAREQTSGTTVACHGNPPTNALGMRYIIAGSTSSVAYTLLAPDTATATGLLVAAMQKGAGTYTTWGSATPFTNAGFSGYWRATRAFGTIAYDSVSLMESQEGCVVQFAQASTGSTSTNCLGAMFDPLGSTTNQSETDGRVYSLIAAGANSVTSSSWLGNVNDGQMMGQHVATAHACHAGYFQPRTNTIRTTARFGSFGSVGSTFQTADSEPVGVPMVVRDVVSSAVVGSSRQWYIARDQFSRTTIINGSVTIGYTVAATINTTAGNTVMLRY